METTSIVNNFMARFIDWKEFEKFVAEMYGIADNVVVQHNVTEIGKSGAKRQIDVLVTLTTQLHKIKMLIECKMWKSKVDRPVIDVMAAAIEDLSANKGVIFTTVGFEEGAVEYAKSKNIDLFLIREVYNDEWGNPGRVILLYFQIFSAMMTNITFTNAKFISTNGEPNPGRINIGIHLTKEALVNEEYRLFAISDEQGPNLVQVLINVRTGVLQHLFDQFEGLFQPADQDQQAAYSTPVEIDFTSTPYRFLKRGNGLVTFDAINFDLLQSVSQFKYERDRTDAHEFVVMVENYISRQRNFVSKAKDKDKVIISEDVQQPEQKPDDKEVFKNGMVAKISTDYTVSADVKPGTQILTTNKVSLKFNVPGK